MEETGSALFLGELVVEAHRSFGLQDVRWNALVVEELQGFRANLQCLEDAFGKHHHLGPVLQEFLNIGRLNPGAGRVPVSFQSHSRTPPGQSFASLKVRPPSTSMRPQERCVIRSGRPFGTIGLFSAAAPFIQPNTQGGASHVPLTASFPTSWRRSSTGGG